MNKILLFIIFIGTTSLNAQSHKLIDYLPETSTISTPDNLLKSTNALNLFLSNFYKKGKLVSTLLASKTENTIYDHSEIIYRRLNKSSLEDIITITTKGHQVISTKIKRGRGR